MEMRIESVSAAVLAELFAKFPRNKKQKRCGKNRNCKYFANGKATVLY